MNDSIVIFPTYNEKLNIIEIINNVLSEGFEVLVIDDNSPDKTYELVESSFLSNKKVNLIKRKEKMGLGSAYREGFAWAIKKNYDYIIEMDADFSHKIQDLVRLNKSKDKNKLIIGSRYVPNGEIVGWDFKENYYLNMQINLRNL